MPPHSKRRETEREGERQCEGGRETVGRREKRRGEEGGARTDRGGREAGKEGEKERREKERRGEERRGAHRQPWRGHRRRRVPRARSRARARATRPAATARGTPSTPERRVLSEWRERRWCGRMFRGAVRVWREDAGSEGCCRARTKGVKGAASTKRETGFRVQASGFRVQGGRDGGRTADEGDGELAADLLVAHVVLAREGLVLLGLVGDDEALAEQLHEPASQRARA
eukprot:3756611-Rhodomonas_salina.3